MKTSLEAFEQLSPFIWRIMGLNPSPMTLSGTNTYLLGQKENRVLIDTGSGVDQYKENLEKVLKQTGSNISKILITHWHLDHTLGLKQVLEISPSAKVYKQLIGLPEDEEMENKLNFKYNHLAPNQEIKDDGITIIAIRCPGHTEDHMGYHFKEENAFFCGDCIMGWGSSRVDEMSTYLQSLKEIKTLAVDCLYSAHGPEIIGRESVDNKIEEYIKHRMNREKQILQSLKDLNGEGDVSVLLDKVYSDVKDERLKIEARKNLVVHLRKLVIEGKIQEVMDKQSPDASTQKYRLNEEKI